MQSPRPDAAREGGGDVHLDDLLGHLGPGRPRHLGHVSVFVGDGAHRSEEDAVDRVLPEAVNDPWRLDADNVVQSRHNVVDVVKLCARRLVGLDPLRP